MTIYHSDPITQRSAISPVNLGTVQQQKLNITIAADSEIAADDIFEMLSLPASCTLVSLRLINTSSITDSTVTISAGLMSGKSGEDYDEPDLGEDPSVARTLATTIGTSAAIATAADLELLSLDNGNLFTDYHSDDAQSIGLQFSEAVTLDDDFVVGIIVEYRAYQKEDAE